MENAEAGNRNSGSRGLGRRGGVKPTPRVARACLDEGITLAETIRRESPFLLSLWGFSIDVISRFLRQYETVSQYHLLGRSDRT